ncbi:hypothetical protein C7E13_21050 [Stenotrophomonas maltophilia]|nr:hypothetical protein C7E13_21050 [Stenotrophomonas maltophilia]
MSTKVDTYQSGMPFRQIAGTCRRRGGSGCGSVRGMDAAAKPPRTGLRRLPQPGPPRLPTENQLLPLPLPLPASGRHYRGCRAQPSLPPLQHPCPNVASIAARAA